MGNFKKSCTFIVILCLLKYSKAYKIACDDWWTGFSESSSCYLLMSHHPENYNDAKKICEKYDSHLVIIDTIPEKVSLYLHVKQTYKHFRLVSLRTSRPNKFFFIGAHGT